MKAPGVHLGLLGMALLWGASWPAGRALALVMPPLAASAWRFLLAALVLLAWMRWKLGGWPRLTARQWAGLALAGAVGVFGYSSFFMLALQHTEAGRAALVVTVNPVLTTVLAAWLFGERFNARIALGLLLAVTGAATVLTHGEPWRLLAGEIGRGDGFLLGCVATWSTYSLLGKRLMAGIDSLVATAITAAIGGVLLWVAALLLEGPAQAWHAVSALPPHGTFSLLFLALGATVLAYAWFYRGIEVLGAGVASSYISLVPVFGVALGAVLLGEALSASLLAGGALAILGVVVANRARQ